MILKKEISIIRHLWTFHKVSLSLNTANGASQVCFDASLPNTFLVQHLAKASFLRTTQEVILHRWAHTTITVSAARLGPPNVQLFITTILKEMTGRLYDIHPIQ